MKKIDVNLKNVSYQICFHRGGFKKIIKYMKSLDVINNAALIIDSTVANLYGDMIRKTFAGFKGLYSGIVIPSGEKSKSNSELLKIYKFLINKGFGRDSTIIAIGGGVVGDLAGFAAATYMRGVKLIQVPTTFLSAVDSSVGGKTGINFGNGKNIIGAFYQPKFVLIDSDFFGTLASDDIICGLGEAFKSSYISNKHFFDYLTNNIDKILNKKIDVLETVSFEAIKAKSSVVETDEKEKGARKILNFGHTFAHALESGANYKIKHGAAVIVGMLAALILSKRIGVLENKKYYSLIKPLLQFDLLRGISIPSESKLYELMKIDKKNFDSKIKFVLLKDVGEVYIDVEAERKVVIETLEETLDYMRS